MATGLRTQILAAPLLLSVLALGVVGSSACWVVRDLLLSTEDRRIAALLDQAEDLLDREGREVGRMALNLADNLDLGVHLEGQGPRHRVVQKLLPWKVRGQLDLVDLIDASGQEVLSLDAEGDAVARLGDPPRLEAEEEGFFRLGMSGINLSGTLRGEREALLVGVAPVKSRLSGEVVGVLLLGRRVDTAMLLGLARHLDARVALYDHNGNPVASSASDFHPDCRGCHPGTGSPAHEPFQHGFVPSGGRAPLPFGLPEQRLGMREASVAGEPLGILVAERDLGPTSRALNRGLLLLGTMALLFCGCAVGALVGTARRITRPVRALAAATGRRARGDLDGEVEPAGAREIREMTASFNAMTARLRESEAQKDRLVGEMEQRVEERTKALGEAVERLLKVNELGRALPRAADEASILRAAVPLVAASVGARAGFALLEDDRPGTWRVESIYGRLVPRELTLTFPEELPVPSLLSPRDGLLLQAGRDASLIDPVSGRPVRALLAAPLGDGTARSRRGILLLYDSEAGGGFSRRDLEVVLPFAREVTAAVAVAHLHGENQRAALGLIQALVNTIEAKDPYTQGHTLRVTRLAVTVARHLGLSEDRVELVRQAAALHDIGKIGIRHELLNKPESLTDLEYDLVKQHPLIGARILEAVGFLREVAEIILQHHERPDGSGYPLGMTGEQLGVESRILAATDAFDAMTHDRPYRKGVPPRKALLEMGQKVGSLFDPEILVALEQALTEAA